jgi:ABC-type spermidine/putrescine transport system permease subunit II
MSRSKLVIGLADSQLGNQLWDELQWMSGATNAVTVGATSTNLGVSGGTLAFFGVTGATRATSAAVTDFATLKVALQNYGLIGT